jgi:glutathione S-transferase
MKLYYSKAACSMAVHIALEELELPYEAVLVDLTQDPTPEFLKLNPLGQVPVLELAPGQSITEIAMILQYLADQKPESGLAPKQGSFERYRLQEVLNFISTEIHKGFGPLWSLDSMTQNTEARTEIRQYFIQNLNVKLDVLNQKFKSQPFLMPTGYTVADAYLFTILNWSKYLKVSLDAWPDVKDYVNRIYERPATLRTLKAEHLLSTLKH